MSSLSAFRVTCLDCSQFGRSQEVEAEPEMEVAEPEMEVAEQVEAPVEATEGMNKKSKKQKKDQTHLQGTLSNAREWNGKLNTSSEKKSDAVDVGSTRPSEFVCCMISRKRKRRRRKALRLNESMMTSGDPPLRSGLRSLVMPGRTMQLIRENE